MLDKKSGIDIIKFHTSKPKRIKFMNSRSRRPPIITRPVLSNNMIRKCQTMKPRPITITGSKTTVSPISEQSSFLDDPYCIKLREDNWDGCNLSELSNSQLDMLLLHLKEYAADRALKDDFQSAEKASQICDSIKKMRNMHENRNKLNITTLTITNEELLTEDAIIKKFKEDMENLENFYVNKEKSLVKRQNMELERFENDWKEIKSKRYSKPSSVLLRKQELLKNLTDSGDFDRAKLIKYEIQLLIKEEAALSKEQVNIDYKVSKEKLLSLHRLQRRNLIDSKHHEIGMLTHKRDSVIRLINNKNNVLQIKEREKQVKMTKLQNQYSMKFPYSNEKVLPLFTHTPNDPVVLENDERMMKEKQKKQKELCQRSPNTMNSSDDTKKCLLQAEEAKKTSVIQKNSTNSNYNKDKAPHGSQISSVLGGSSLKYKSTGQKNGNSEDGSSTSAMDNKGFDSREICHGDCTNMPVTKEGSDYGCKSLISNDNESRISNRMPAKTSAMNNGEMSGKSNPGLVVSQNESQIVDKFIDKLVFDHNTDSCEGICLLAKELISEVVSSSLYNASNFVYDPDVTKAIVSDIVDKSVVSFGKWCLDPGVVDGIVKDIIENSVDEYADVTSEPYPNVVKRTVARVITRSIDSIGVNTKLQEIADECIKSLIVKAVRCL